MILNGEMSTKAGRLRRMGGEAGGVIDNTILRVEFAEHGRTSGR